MKKLLVLTTLGILVASVTGCQWCNRLFRGSRTQTTPVMGTMMMDPCGVPCDPCAPPACRRAGPWPAPS